MYPTEEFEESGGTLGKITVGFVIASVGFGWMRYRGKGIRDIESDFDESDLKNVASQAQSSLDTLIDFVHTHEGGAVVKYASELEDGGVEYLMADVIRIDSGTVVIGEEGDTGEEFRLELQPSEVLDWKFVDSEGLIHGSFTLRALFAAYEKTGKRLTPKMEQEKAELYGIAPST
jgi:uncharacterized protein YegJ (DUF2314 family)